MSKSFEADAVVAAIPNGATVVVGGTGVAQEPDLLLEALERRFLTEGKPRELTLVTPMLPGDRPGEGGLNCVAHDGLLKRIIGASFSRARHPRLLEMIREERCEGYVVGMGLMIQLLTAIGSGKPGVFTRVGLGSFMDPRDQGGRMNKCSKEPPVRVETIDGVDYLFYPAFPIDIAIIRGTTADENGYISMEEEPNTLGMVELALAAKASGGKVLAQVKRLARANSLDPRTVKVPGPLVDMISVHSRQRQLSASMADPLAGWNPFLAGALKAPLDEFPPVEPGSRRVILRRAALELRRGDVVNLGAGVATHLPRITLEEGYHDAVVFTNEHGVFGGLMGTALGGSFVPALNADAIMDSGFQFNFYDGGGLDITFLGIGQVDAAGNLNVSRFGDEINGPGGFNNITDRTPRIVFCGSLSAGGLKLEVENGSLRIIQEGKFRKFVGQVEQVTFNAQRALQKGQRVLYVTERAVFELREEGLVLIEVAPGIDVDQHVRPQVEFPLRVAPNLREMPKSVFVNGALGLGESLDRQVGKIAQE